MCVCVCGCSGYLTEQLATFCCRMEKERVKERKVYDDIKMQVQSLRRRKRDSFRKCRSRNSRKLILNLSDQKSAVHIVIYLIIRNILFKCNNHPHPRHLPCLLAFIVDISTSFWWNNLILFLFVNLVWPQFVSFQNSTALNLIKKGGQNKHCLLNVYTARTFR